MPKTFQDILPTLEAWREQAAQGALPLGHAMELRRREKRQAMGCPSDEELCGYTDGQLKTVSPQRWAEVRWHVRRCQHCQGDVEGLCEALELDIHKVVAVDKPARQRLFHYVASAAAAVLILGVLGVSGYLPALFEWPARINDMGHVQSPASTPPLVGRQPSTESQAANTLTLPPSPDAGNPAEMPTMKVSIPSESDPKVSPLLRVAICSETERPTCGAGMELMSVVGAECQVTGDESSCAAKSAAGGCAICLVSQ